MIHHGSPCDYCEDLKDCREAGKDVSIGCDDWLLAFNTTEENADGTIIDDQCGGKQTEYTVDSEGNVLGTTVQ